MIFLEISILLLRESSMYPSTTLFERQPPKRSGLTSLRVRNFDYNYAASVINMIN
ncbi:unnamed protein product [Tenebrio molitor]|nr:unnamed protein product [Tenebrio molitor]